MKRPENFEECCEIAGVNVATDEILSLPDTPATLSAKKHRRLEIIGLALNGDWTPDMSDTSQRKYFPWHEVIPDTEVPSGFRLACGGCGYDDANACLGSRHYYKDANTAIYAGKQFIKEYESVYSAI